MKLFLKKSRIEELKIMALSKLGGGMCIEYAQTHITTLKAA
jgi:hypothetical protein